MVEGSGGDLALAVGGARIALTDPGDLVPGQAVVVEVAETAQGLQLRVVPQAPAAAGDGAGGGALAHLVRAVLESLGAARIPQAPEQILPAQLPHTEATVRSLASLFALRGTLGRDLEQIVALVTQARAAGALLQEGSGETATVLSQLLAGDPSTLKGLPERLLAHTGRTVEGRIAQAMAAADPAALQETLRGDLQAILSRLQDDDALAAFLRGSGQLRAFRDAVGRVMERLSAGQLQNLRSLDQDYAFIELPFGAESPITRGQIHVIGEGGGPRRRIDPKNALVAFDLSTTKLGDLWITLRVVQGHCNCRLCATSSAAVESIEEASAELSDRLREAGYARATVNAALWDGDRLREVVLLMRRFSGLDVSA